MIFSYLLNMQSHPSWVCGLKLFGSKRSINFTEEDFVELKDLIIG